MKCEKGRIKYEKGRMKCEKGRIKYEKGRIKCEKGRIKCEKGRIKYEKGRIKCEKQIDLKLGEAKIKKNFNKKIKEIKFVEETKRQKMI